MIDTIKIYTKISKEIYDIIYNNSIIKTSFSNSTGELFYNIVNDHLEGSYSSSLSVRVEHGGKYGFIDDYCIEIEGSLHKLRYGYNSHMGFYDVKYVANYLIGIVEESYKIELPQIEYWYIFRIDLAICYDLENQQNVVTYISNLKKCTFPRRKVNFFKDESLYCSGSYTTLKIYNKLAEFKKHDVNKFKNKNFDLINYMDFIKGFIRFEVEIKKRKLLSVLNKEKYVKIIDIDYENLKKVWSEEFMKLLKCCEKEMLKLNEKERIYKLINEKFKKRKARSLYNFYLSVLVDGLEKVKETMASSTYYDNLSDLKKLNIDFSQTYNVEFTNKYIDFNPFTFEEVA